MIPETVIESYGLGHGSIEAINTGLINETWKLSTNNDDFIFQKINPIFPEQIHESIHKITKILLQDDIGSIEIIRTKNGELIHKENNEIWRVTKYISGDNFEITPDAEYAFSLGKGLAQMQKCLRNVKLELPIRTIKETDKRYEELISLIKLNQDHSQIKTIHLYAEEISKEYDALDQRLEVDDSQMIHGDPKISNAIFVNGSPEIRAWIDFDTIAVHNPYDEIGDAIRSWCNPFHESDTESQIDQTLLKAALEGILYFDIYREINSKSVIQFYTKKITLRLAMRFLIDAMTENYFYWDKSKYDTLSEQNIVRTRAQLNLLKSIDSAFMTLL